MLFKKKQKQNKTKAFTMYFWEICLDSVVVHAFNKY